MLAPNEARGTARGEAQERVRRDPQEDGGDGSQESTRCALKGRKVYSIWPIQNIIVTKKYLKLDLARHICISQNSYRVILFTSLPYSIIRKN